MILLLGLVPVSGSLCGLAIWHLDGPARALTLAGSAAYGRGVFAVTGPGNVPMNTRLDAMDGQLHDTAEYRPRKAQGWTCLKRARTAGSALSALR